MPQAFLMPKLFAIAALLFAGNMASLAARDALDTMPTHTIAATVNPGMPNPAIDPQKKAWFGQSVEKILDGGTTPEASAPSAK